MTKAQKLRTCDWILLILLPLIFASSIQLEATSSGGLLPVIIHIILALPFMCLIIYHIYLHFQWKKWLAKFSKLKLPTRILWWLYLITFLTGLIAFGHWLIEKDHSSIGGVHGKFGFLMLIFAIGHTTKRIKFFKKK